MPERDSAMLNSLFEKELHNSGLYPERAIIQLPGDSSDNCNGLWSIDFVSSKNQPPIYKACFSPLNGHILRQMSGIIITSAGILILMGFLIWYLLHWVGRLRTIEQMKDDFTHNMTHELKTPVAVAYSAADSMLRYYDQSDESRNRQFLKIIMQRLSFLSGMIENILSMSMERFKTMKLDIESIAVKPIVEEVGGMMELKADKPVKIDINIPDNLTVQADSLHFGNVLSNLIDNAVKYSGDSVDITIKADARSITITDNGIGIDKENIPYIFDKFYRVASGDRYEVGGYGLGLFYVKQIVELFGWSIDVTSRPGQGTKFTLNSTGMKKDKILLVEDDSTLSFIVQDALTREGFDVDCASNGEAGLRVFKESCHDIIVADVMMPKMDGFEMVRLIRLTSPAVPVLFLTARTALDDVVKGFELGANDYIRKPFQILELVVRIKALLKRNRQGLAEDTNLPIGDCALDFASQRLVVGTDTIELSHTEAVIVDELFRHPNEVVEARTLIYRIWQNDDYNNLNRLHGFIYKLRKYLSKSSELDLLNVRGVGYKLAVNTTK